MIVGLVLVFYLASHAMSLILQIRECDGLNVHATIPCT